MPLSRLTKVISWGVPFGDPDEKLFKEESFDSSFVSAVIEGMKQFRNSPFCKLQHTVLIDTYAQKQWKILLPEIILETISDFIPIEWVIWLFLLQF